MEELLARVRALLRRKGAAEDDHPLQLADLTLEQTVTTTLLGLLDYNIYATENGKLVLGGSPFDNTTRNYPFSALFGRDLDGLVARYTASPTALANLPPYNTTGVLTKPLVIMHTTGDPIVPYWHMDLYQAKVAARGYAGNLSRYDVNRYGHCNFTQAEIMGALDMLSYLGTGLAPELHTHLLPESEQGTYLRMLAQGGAIN